MQIQGYMDKTVQKYTMCKTEQSLLLTIICLRFFLTDSSMSQVYPSKIH